MAKVVIKKDGTREPFNPAKIRKAIGGAAKRTRLSDKRKKEVVEEVSEAVIKLAEGKEVIRTSEIRGKILRELGKAAPSVAAEWRKYEQKKKKK